MQSPFETTAFRENFKMLSEHPGKCSPGLITQLMNTPDTSSLPTLDNPLFNLLIKSLKDENSQIRGSAKAYMAYRMMKTINKDFFELLFALFNSQRIQEASEAFFQLAAHCDQLDEEDFKLLCQAISTYPLSTLDWDDFKLHKLTPLVKIRLPQLCSHLHSLTSLSFVSTPVNQYTDEDWETFCKIISSHPNLSKLGLGLSRMESLDVNRWELLGNAFTSLPNLSKLDLRPIFQHAEALNESKWTAFCQTLSKATHLVSLKVSHSGLTVFNSKTLDIWESFRALFNSKTFNSWETFCNALSQLHQLESLTLEECNLHEVNTAGWQHLKKLTPLTTLSLINNSLGKDPEAWKGLCNALGSLPHLTSLDLSGNALSKVGNEGWQAFRLVFASLKYLSLNMIGKTALKDCEALFQGIRESNLVSLDLGYNSGFLERLDKPSFDLFCRAIVDAKQLSELILYGNTFGEISQDRFDMFWKAIVAASHLSTLFLSENRFASQLMPILIEGIAKAKHLTTVHLGSTFDLNATEWQFFWNTFNHDATHVTSLQLGYSRNIEARSAFTQGLTEAKHLHSLGLMGDMRDGEEKLILDALESLFDLVAFYGIYALKTHPRVEALLKRNQLKAKLEELTTLLNSPDPDLNANELKYAFEHVATEFDNLLQDLPDTPSADPYREEARRVLEKFYFASAQWFAINNEPQLAIDAYTELSASSKHFQKARENAFTIAFQTYLGGGDTRTQAFSKALPLCMHANRLIQLDGEFQRVFDGFLLEAIGFTKTLHLLSDITPQIRLKAFKYLGLLILKEELQHIKTTQQTDFFYKPQLQQGLVDMLAGLKLLSSLEELDAVGLDALWTSAKRKHESAAVSSVTAVIPSEARDLVNVAERDDSWDLLCQVVAQQEAPGEAAETAQKEGLRL